MTALWTSAEMEAATGGQATHAFDVTGLSIDSREIASGDLFVALSAARDGHDFVRDAFQNGAAGALVSYIPKGCEDLPLLIVDDVMKGLQSLGRAGRSRTKAKVIGVTGSVGKTSTKEMLRSVLAGQGSVHAAEKSFNNHWGVPITLARMPKDVDYAVIEIGMNAPGEIGPLAQMADLDVALITTVAPAHLFAFPNVEAIAHEKASIVEGLRPDGCAVLPVDIPASEILRAAIKGQKVLTFGEGRADFRLTAAQQAGDTVVAKALCHGEEILFKVATLGRHFALNGLAVLAVVEALGLDTAVASCDLGHWHPVQGRGLRERIIMDVVEDHLTIDLIDDAFNANPASVAAALDVLAAIEPFDDVGRIAHGRRIAVLGDMLELGPTELALHADIAKHPALESIDLVHCVGPRMQALHAALPLEKQGEWHEEANTLASRIHHVIDAGDVVLVKGSKSTHVSRVVDAIRNLGHLAPIEG